MVISRNPSAGQLGFSFEEQTAVRKVWPVRELVEEVCRLVERKFVDVWVEGEVSNLRPAPSGHLYFTLKDAEAQLPVVLFRRQAMLLRFQPEDGLRVHVRGRVSVYQQRGQLQLVAETMEPVGAGSLQLAFEQLKNRLRAEGLFDADQKQPLPSFPRTVGIVTSPTGAVIRDILNIIDRRHSGLNVLLVPVAVQGESAPEEIEIALAQLNSSNLVDVIILARGGGSIEDLAAFNSERVARAISASKLPIVSAVGHETDFTIADFVADLRAPTPSAAAELITEAQHKIAAFVAHLDVRAERAARYRLLQAKQRFESLRSGRMEWRITAILNRLHQRLDDHTLSIESRLRENLKIRHRNLLRCEGAVLRHDPRRALGRIRERLALSSTHLERAMERNLRDGSARLHSIDARLHSLSPVAVLERGYALVQSGSGKLIRTVHQVFPGERLTTIVKDGTFTSTVEGSNPRVTSRTRKPRKHRVDE